MVTFTTRARYALRLMLDVSRATRSGTPARLNEVAERTDLSRRYLDQLVLPLKTAGLLRGRRGPQGGYNLSRPADQIRLDQIMEASVGRIALSPCVEDQDYCDRSEFCECRQVYRLLSLRLRASLAEITLADLSDSTKLDGIREQAEQFEAIHGNGHVADQTCEHCGAAPLKENPDRKARKGG